MRMDDQGESQNVEDVRGSSGGFRPVHGIGLGTIVVALIGGWIFGINPLQILGLLSGGSSAIQAPATDETRQTPPADRPDSKLRSQTRPTTERDLTTPFHKTAAQ